jgi:hypothetical protein
MAPASLDPLKTGLAPEAVPPRALTPREQEALRTYYYLPNQPVGRVSIEDGVAFSNMTGDGDPCDFESAHDFKFKGPKKDVGTVVGAAHGEYQKATGAQGTLAPGILQDEYLQNLKIARSELEASGVHAVRQVAMVCGGDANNSALSALAASPDHGTGLPTYARTGLMYSDMSQAHPEARKQDDVGEGVRRLHLPTWQPEPGEVQPRL